MTRAQIKRFIKVANNYREFCETDKIRYLLNAFNEVVKTNNLTITLYFSSNYETWSFDINNGNYLLEYASWSGHIKFNPNLDSKTINNYLEFAEQKLAELWNEYKV